MAKALRTGRFGRCARLLHLEYVPHRGTSSPVARVPAGNLVTVNRKFARKLLSIMGLLWATLSGQSALAASLPPGFTDQVVTRPDGRPWDGAEGVTFAADGRMFVWERTGRVWVVGDP